MMNKSRNIIVLILVIFMISITGCSKGSAEKKPDTTGQKPKAPTALKSISTDLDKLISELDKKVKMKTMPLMQQNIQLNPQAESQNDASQGGQSQSGQSQGGQSQGGQSQGGQSQGGQSQGGQSQGGQSQGGQSQSQAQAADWQKEFTSLKNIHTNWNSLMPEAVQAGMRIDARDQFEKALEQLTQEISKQKPKESLSAALMVYKNYADMAQIFTNSVPAELYQVKYEIMAAVYEASQKNWSTAEEHLPKIKEHWVYLSAQAKDVDAKVLSRTEFSVLDLEKAIQSKQMESVIIKGEIAMNNLKSLESKASGQSSSQGQSQESGQNQSSNQSSSQGQSQ